MLGSEGAGRAERVRRGDGLEASEPGGGSRLEEVGVASEVRALGLGAAVAEGRLTAWSALGSVLVSAPGCQHTLEDP